MDLQHFIDKASALIAEVGDGYFFAPSTIAAGEAIDLDAFAFYGLGRAGVMGDVQPSVVSSAFGYFKPSVVEFLWNEGRARCEPEVAAAAHLEAASTYARAHLEGVDDLGSFNELAEAIVAAHPSASAPLAAALAARPLPDEPLPRAYRLILTLRELRGGAHLVAVVACGLEPRVAHFIAAPESFTLYGWGNDDVPEVGNAEIEAMARAQDLTDEIVAPAFAVVPEARREDFVAVLEAMASRLGEVANAADLI